jgi:hypothetical protein
MIKNTKFWETADLLKEEQRLIALIDRQKGYKFRKGPLFEAARSLSAVQRELSRRVSN